MARLTFTNGALVNVPARKVENLLRRGFTQEKKAAVTAAPTKKATAKKAASSTTKKS